MEQVPDAFHAVLLTVHWKYVHCSYRLKFFVAKNHLRNGSLSNCSVLGSRFARSCSRRPSQRSQYTEGVALRMTLSRKCVQKKIRPRWAACMITSQGCPHYAKFFAYYAIQKFQ